MQFYSTNHQCQPTSLKQALFQGLAPDGGLFMPESIPIMDKKILDKMSQMELPEIAFEVTKKFISTDLSKTELKTLVEEVINFPAPLVQLNKDQFVLELFHGPTLAFKDFGARFMARLMDKLNDSNQLLTVLVATSGDTGSAVAHGFYQVPGIEVVILYPGGQVSEIQEKQLTTLGGNVKALEVEGTFDDCQAMVKAAFVDDELKAKLRLTSANSINIGRLIPQSFYYFYAISRLQKKGKPIICSVPSGNFGNMTAGIMAKIMGAPIKKIIAATNANDVFPHYLTTGKFEPKPSRQTISNAMDIGNPSNFTRLNEIYNGSVDAFRRNIWSSTHSDEETMEAIKIVQQEANYIIDPHGAVGYLALQKYRTEVDNDNIGIIFETAHPAKFKDTVEKAIGKNIKIPERLAECLDKEKQVTVIENEYEELKEYLFS